MKNPSHPGRLVRSMCLEPLGIGVTDAAKALVNQKTGVSPEMAVRLSKAFGSSPEMWMRLQIGYELAHVRRENIKGKRYRLAS
ncbi:MAG TPA: HigA family addiction module antitoxin [Bryobacteraceae bacterium]|nr:HigA family addiction module antitoxin [Bryobacteraceae bacterium]